MAEATRTQPEIPAYTILLQLTQEEAAAVLAVLDGDGDIVELRRDNQLVYHVLDALGRVVDA